MAQLKQYADKFLMDFVNFVSVLHEIKPTLETKTFLDNRFKVNSSKLAEDVADIVLPLRDRIVKRDETLFTRKLILSNHLNLSYFWKHSTHSQRQTIFDMLKKIVVYCKIIYNINDTPVTRQIVQPTTDDEFNPFIGVGTNGSLSINSMLEQTQPSASQTDGMNPMLNMMMSQFNMKDISEQLHNIDDSALAQVPNMLQSLMGGAIDPAVSSMLKSMVSGIGDELRNTDITKGNLMENIAGIAQKMSHKLENDVKNGVDLPIEKIVASTSNLMKNMGLPQNPSEINPMQLMGMLANIASMQKQ